ncbi:2-hydroxyacyl-CoA dehydratase subunit D [Thermodesulfobacteriota bacterium]
MHKPGTEKKGSEMVEYKINRMETTKLIGPMVDQHWREIREAKDHGKLVAWGVTAPISMLFAAAMDNVKVHFYAGYSSYVAGRGGAADLLDTCQNVGYLRDSCSYLRAHVGMMHKYLRDEPIREEIRLPLPDFLVNGCACPEQANLIDAVARRLNIPVVAVQLPSSHYEPLEDRIRFVERQLKEYAIPQLEEICGRPYNYDRLSEMLLDLKNTATVRNECWDLMKHVPAPCTLWDYAVSMAPIIYMSGKPGNVEYYRKFKAELEERVAQNRPAILPEEKYRIMWDGLLPWAHTGFYIRKFRSYGAVPIVGRYPMGMYPHPYDIDPDNPIRSLAVQAIRDLLGDLDPAIGLKFVREAAEDYSIDGIVFYQSRTCRIWDNGQQTILNEMERTLGTPGIIVEGDMIDPVFHSEAQIETRLQALFEMIDARRKSPNH